MRRDILEIDSPRPLHSSQNILDHPENIRLLLTGNSVIDWPKAHFVDIASVNHFLRLHRIDPELSDDRERLRYVFNEAVSYLEEHLHLRFSADLRNPSDVRDIFLWASDKEGHRRRQTLACVILKLMHVIHHMEAADLKFKLAMSEEQLFEIAETQLLEAARKMLGSGLPIVSFYGSRKTRSSILSKLIAKRENLAATVFDKLRFRLVVEQASDLPLAMQWLTEYVFPFNYVIPGQSYNNLINPDTLLPEASVSPTPQAQPKNQFSGTSYQSINFIADYPIIVEPPPGRFLFELGRVVYVMVEFQLVDEATAQANENGENSHGKYKQRQLDVIARRLKHGR